MAEVVAPPDHARAETSLVLCQTLVLGFGIPAQAGNWCRDLDSRLRGNDGEPPNFKTVGPSFKL